MSLREHRYTEGAGGERRVSDPFFIVYKARSGSTHLADLLTLHPEVGIAPESNLVVNLWRWSSGGRRAVVDEASLREALDLLYAEPKFVTWGVARASLEESLSARLPLCVGEVARAALDEYCALRYPQSRVRGIKKGSYALHVPALRALFPSSKFILLVRDGRAVYASSKRARHSDTHLPFETDPVRSALVWKRVVTALDRYSDPRHFLQLRYEELIAEPEPALRRVLDFLEVPAPPAILESMLRPHDPAFVHERYTYLHPHVGKTGQLSRIDGWRDELPPDEIRKFERVAGRTLAGKGYQPLYSTSAWEQLRSTLLATRLGRKLNKVLSAE